MFTTASESMFAQRSMLEHVGVICEVHMRKGFAKAKACGWISDAWPLGQDLCLEYPVRRCKKPSLVQFLQSVRA